MTSLSLTARSPAILPSASSRDCSRAEAEEQECSCREQEEQDCSSREEEEPAWERLAREEERFLGLGEQSAWGRV